MFAMLFQLPPSRCHCQRTMVPVWPESVMLPVGVLIQIGPGPPEVVPPTDSGSTCMLRTDEYASEQEPLLTSALNSHVPIEVGVKEYVVVILATLIHVAEGSSLLSSAGQYRYDPTG